MTGGTPILGNLRMYQKICCLFLCLHGDSSCNIWCRTSPKNVDELASISVCVWFWLPEHWCRIMWDSPNKCNRFKQGNSRGFWRLDWLYPFQKESYCPFDSYLEVSKSWRTPQITQFILLCSMKKTIYFGDPQFMGSSAGWLPQQHSAMLRAMAFRFTLHADGGVMIDDAREHGGRVAMFNGFSRCFRPVIFFSNGMANLSHLCCHCLLIRLIQDDSRVKSLVYILNQLDR